MMTLPGFGVCRLNLISVRSEPSHRAEQVTQLLFGEEYEVIEQREDWLKIRLSFDQYEGWIDALQHHPVSIEYFEYLKRADFKITTDITSTLLYNKSPLMILMGSMIPISSAELFKMEEQFAFNGDAKNLGQKREFDFLKAIALRYLNVPYQWGGKSPFGIDCSGLVQIVFKICGYKLMRDAWQQATQGKIVPENDVRPGDIAFFDLDGRITHTGILLAEDKIIHASGKVRIDAFSFEGIYNNERHLITHRLSHIRRMLA